MKRRILAVVSDSGRAQGHARLLQGTDHALATCMGVENLASVLLAFRPDTVIVDLDRFTWAAERTNLEQTLRGQDVVVVLRDRGAGPAALIRRVGARGIVTGVPTWDALRPWLDRPEPVSPTRPTSADLRTLPD